MLKGAFKKIKKQTTLYKKELSYIKNQFPGAKLYYDSNRILTRIIRLPSKPEYLKQVTNIYFSSGFYEFYFSKIIMNKLYKFVINLKHCIIAEFDSDQRSIKKIYDLPKIAKNNIKKPIIKKFNKEVVFYISKLKIAPQAIMPEQFKKLINLV